MKNCLVTKLKAVVDNNDLEYLGGIEFIVNSESDITGQVVRSIDTDNARITVIGNGTMTVNTSPATTYGDGETFVIPNLARTLTFSAGNYKVRIDNKYALADLRFGGVTWKSLNQVKNCNDLTILVVTTLGYVPGNLSSLEGMTKLTQLALDRTYGYTGNIKSLGKLTSLTSLNITKNSSYASLIEGDVLDFVGEQVKGGRTTMSSDSPLSCNGILEQVTFNGKTVLNASSARMTWESSSGIPTKIAVYNGSSVAGAARVIVYGYSGAEIATNTASGGIWNGKTVQQVD